MPSITPVLEEKPPPPSSPPPSVLLDPPDPNMMTAEAEMLEAVKLTSSTSST